ncbi:hypothetical protein EW026_g7824 [Hermanssonia centrifuga]|uniref:Oxidase ustYa n=1 Tax=Hermanssonia centrifuga TaxID=98765 RepID=A0A4S4K6I3_9APHY|nr:hypothetical protein EW026_g7824 [Hermanssonia centrifuga]
MFLFARRLQGLRRQPIPYTYVGDDFPEFLPHEPVRGDLSMTFFEDPASSFPISGPGTAELWESIYPPGYGFVRLGDESRLLCVAMFHQLHCIEKMRIFLDDPTNKHVAFGHQQHCMNYLRQLFLCKADLTLEPIIALDYPAQALDSSVDLVMKSGSRVVHSCGDWETVYDTVGDNYKKWKASWNISSPFTSESE